jgi:hypothetical protein
MLGNRVPVVLLAAAAAVSASFINLAAYTGKNCKSGSGQVVFNAVAPNCSDANDVLALPQGMLLGSNPVCVPNLNGTNIQLSMSCTADSASNSDMIVFGALGQYCGHKPVQRSDM